MEKKSRYVDAIEEAEQILHNAVTITEMAMELKDRAIAAEKYVNYLRCLAARSSKTVAAMRNTGKSFVSIAHRIAISSSKLVEKLPPSEPAYHCLKQEYEKLALFLEKEINENDEYDKVDISNQEPVNINLPSIVEKIRSLESRHKLPESTHLMTTSSVRSLKQDVNERYPESYSKESLIDLDNVTSLPPLPEDTFTGYPRVPVKSSSLSSLKNLRKIKFYLQRAESDEEENECQTQDLSVSLVSFIFVEVLFLGNVGYN